MPKTRLPVIFVYVSILTTGEAVSREQGRLDRKMQGTNKRRRRLDYWRTTSYELLGAWMNIFPFSFTKLIDFALVGIHDADWAFCGLNSFSILTPRRHRVKKSVYV